MAGSERPLIALAMGDPAGISPELTAKVLADADCRAAARLAAEHRVTFASEEEARAAGYQRSSAAGC